MELQPAKPTGNRLPIAPMLLAFTAGGLLSALFFGCRGSAVVARVNGVPITEKEFLHRLEVTSGAQVLQQMVAEELHIQFAKKQNVEPSGGDIDAKLAEMRKQPNFEKNLKDTRRTEEDLRREIRFKLSRLNIIGKGVKITDQEVRAYYDANAQRNNLKARYYQPETVQVSAVALNSQEDAQKALTLLANGQDFAAVARSMSVDRSAVDGGALPPIRRGSLNGTPLAAVEQRLFGTPVGGKTEPLQVGKQWWIFRCNDHRAETLVPWERAEEDAREQVLIAKGMPVNNKQMGDEFKRFTTEAKVETERPEYREVIKGR
jgi:parvulin-like peptidyl-prolyl isomerase